MAGRIPRSFIDDLLTRVDIVDVIDSRVPLKKAGKDYKACCPFHDEKTPSFTVSPDKQFFHCFGCGKNGSAIGFLMEYDHMGFREAIEELAARAGVAIPVEAADSATPAEKDETAALIEILGEADRCYRRWLREHPQAGEAVAYLKQRGLTGEIAARFGLGFAPEGWDNLLRAIGVDETARSRLATAGLAVRKEDGSYYDRFRHRVMFPIHDYRGRLIGFGGRVLGQGEPKYLNSPETPLFHKGRELYGLFHARDALKRENRAIVVEGYMDVVALAQFGVDFAIATLGTATTRDHLERLFRYVPDVIFCFDGDRAGREAAWRALENTLPALSAGRQVSFLFLPEGEDPDTLVRKEGAEGFRARLQTAIPLVDYLFQALSQKVDMGRSDGPARLAELARPHVAKVPAGALRDLMLDRLGERSRTAAQSLADLRAAPGAAASARPSGRGGGGQGQGLSAGRTLVRQAITHLVQQPALVKHATDVGFLVNLDRPGVALLTSLIDFLQENPDSTTGQLLENYRDSEHQHHLAKLAVWDYPAENPDLDEEFKGIWRQLRRDWRRQEADRLSQKDRLVGLSPEEKAELRRLLGERD
jgi:DNA primase